jgi:Tfp pilus assembly protein PilV
MNSSNPTKQTTPAIVTGIQDERGFSLIETAIALVVMMVITLAAGSLYVYAINYNSGSNDRAAALAIAQQRMERLRKSSFSDPELTTPSTTSTVVNAGRQYTVVTTICSTPNCGGSAALKLITVQVTPQSATTWANSPATVISERATLSLGAHETK